MRLLTFLTGVIFLNSTDKQLLKKFYNALEEKDAEKILVLDMSKTAVPTDYFFICSGNSFTHIRALRDSIVSEIEDTDLEIISYDKGKDYDWLVIDAGGIVFHFFTRKGREFFALENLWIDADRLSI